MANLTRYNPFTELSRLDPFRDFEDMFRDFRLKNIMRDDEGQQPIRIDVHETEQAYTVKADLPGVNKDDIKVDIQGNRVSIAAETKRVEQDKQSGNVVRSERYYGQQYRSFTLEHDIDDAKAEAKFDSGVLHLTLPKKAQQGSRKLAIH
ncbi:Hsp20/alpha crystallin family protein [Massilia endophytica]|uniref:Hsp20/alpha crystallin family protein n=1 Tax=Massilia endophytica TaxID=2899220 RepID=UPI001E5BC926|nr:Hsp20/alpha crystallin family protein [Massilia endophytica]UGQ48484.1 Hsp20/alpha crystallin family protein [Massilia endophytica]